MLDIGVDPIIDRWVHHWRSGSGWTLAAGRAGASYVLRLAEGESYVFDGEANTVALACQPSQEQRNDLLNQVLPRVLDHQGRFLMHGSAVETRVGALAFVGASGWGKSTLGAAFDTNGAPLLSDDCMEFFVNSDTATCRPTYRSMRLWQDSADAFPPSDAYQRVEGNEDKVRFFTGVDGNNGPNLPLAAVYLLTDPADPVDEVTIGPVAPALAVSELLTHSFRLDPTDTARARSAFDTAADVVQRVPIFSLAHPRDYDRLGEVTQSILEHASQHGAKQTEAG